MTWGQPEEQAPTRRDVMGVRMTPRAGPDGSLPLTVQLEEEIRAAIMAVDGRRREVGKSAVPEALATALPKIVASAAGALEGTLVAKSLEGALTESQIVRNYAEAEELRASAARHRAEEAKLDAEARLAEIEAARSQLRLVLEKCAALGVPVTLARSGEDEPAVVVGCDLTAEPAIDPGLREMAAVPDVGTQPVNLTPLTES